MAGNKDDKKGTGTKKSGSSHHHQEVTCVAALPVLRWGGSVADRVPAARQRLTKSPLPLFCIPQP